jgi:hypothetical protein
MKSSFLTSSQMNTYVNQRRLDLSNIPVAVWLGLALLATTFLYLCILPLFRPRGDFLWGYYRLKDLMLGIPVALAMLFATVVLASPAKHRRPLLMRLVSIFISVVGVVFLCDVVYVFIVLGASRPNFWLDQAHIPRMYSAADAELGFVRKPGVFWHGYIPELNRTVEYRTDENGFRNPPNLKRADIVFIGDSFTEAGQVSDEQSFPQRVAISTGLKAANLGRGAYGPQQELIVLKRYGLAYEPRVVVWQLFEGNDLTDASIFAGWKENPDQITSVRERYFQYSFLSQWLSKTRVRGRDVPLVTLRHRSGTTQRIALRYRYDPSQPAAVPIGLAETIRTIEEGQRLCQARGIQLMIVLVPTLVRVLEPDISFDRREDKLQYLPEEGRADKKDFSSRIEGLCSQIGCSFVDGFAALRQAAARDNGALYILGDEHLDTTGHEVIAQLVLEWLRSRNNINSQTERQ